MQDTVTTDRARGGAQLRLTCNGASASMVVLHFSCAVERGGKGVGQDGAGVGGWHRFV